MIWVSPDIYTVHIGFLHTGTCLCYIYYMIEINLSGNLKLYFYILTSLSVWQLRLLRYLSNRVTIRGCFDSNNCSMWCDISDIGKLDVLCPRMEWWGYIVFILSVCFFNCLSVCMSAVNSYLCYTFFNVRDRDFRFDMHFPQMTPFQMTPRSMTLWPWLWHWSWK